tara:strand:- start:1659 stop:2330 length:672 start_codon:yes stop_codon:yes gene_type:complete
MKNLKIIYINLKQNKERRDHMERMLSSLPSITFERFDAIQPSVDSLKNGEYKVFYDKSGETRKRHLNSTQYRKRGIGVFGCYLSHFKIHEMMLGSDEPYIILEDDITFSKNTFSELDDIINNKKYEDWDIIRSLWDSTDKIVKIRGVHWESTHSYKNYDVPHRIYGGSHFSLFRSAEKIFNYFQNENTMPADSMYSTNLLNVYHSKLDVTIDKRFVTNIPKGS